MVTIIDYGLGNLYSVERAIKYLGSDVVITDDPEIISNAERLILPGVGAFGNGISSLHKKGLIEPIKSFVLSKRPFLGICLGMQLLMSTSEELGIHQGLDLIKGKVVRLFSDADNPGQNCKVPHVGWNELKKPDESTAWDNTILEGLHNRDSVYFVHSYAVIPECMQNILANTTYEGYKFCSVVKKDNLYGCQFHPEKSGEVGLRILEKFLQIN